MVLIVCVDDNETMLDLTADILRLERSECDIHTFVSPKQALSFIKERGCDLLLTDFSMPAMNGVELIGQVKALGYGTYCILVTGSSPYALREHYPGDVFDGLLKKPYSYRELLSLIDVGLRVREMSLAKQEAKALPPEALAEPSGLSRDAAVREVRAFLGRVWEEADLASPPSDLEYGCHTPAYFAVRVKEEIGRAMRYSRSLTVVKIDLDDLKQARAELGLTQDTDLARMVLRIVTPNLRSSDLVTYRHPLILLLLPETSGDAKQHVIQRLAGSLRSRGILVTKGREGEPGLAFSSRTYSFERQAEREPFAEDIDSDV
ncbi:MAG: response regulator [Candidatus Coatesbacteria bacterium]|nr:response regulator [Candidatus Coatesbacteria bacterium]